jgi:hypothetical protein
LTLPTMIIKCLEIRSDDTDCEVSRSSVSLLAFRTTIWIDQLAVTWFSKGAGGHERAVHVYPAFRQLARHGAVLPPVAPKKATLLGEDMMLITLLGLSFDGFQP